MLDVTLYCKDPATDKLVVDSEFEVDFVSFYTDGTHGAPALVAPGRENGQSVKPRAQIDDIVLYVNTGKVPALTIERTSDGS